MPTPVIGPRTGEVHDAVVQLGNVTCNASKSLIQIEGTFPLDLESPGITKRSALFGPLK
jgi:hypothetical protein